MARDSMKAIQKLLICLFIQFCCGTSFANHSRTFFVPRLLSTDSMYELALTNYHRYHSIPDMHAYFSFTPLFIHSAHGEKLARYFLPHNKHCMTLRENGGGDIDPLWFNLIAKKGELYQSKVCLRPERTVTGGVLTWYFNMSYRWWLGVNTAIVRVKHNLHVKENDRNTRGILPGFENACDAFNNPRWEAGRLPCHEQKRTGVDDVQFKLGYDFYKTPCQHATAYLVGTAPTGSRRTGRALFEPLVGSRHGSVGFGFNGDQSLYACDNKEFNIMADFKYLYVFPGTEIRPFDLTKNGDWSRYLLVVDTCERVNSKPGINFFTVPARVKPQSRIDFWLAAHYRRCNFNFELGYDLWWRQAERIENIAFENERLGIQSLNLCALPVTSSSSAKINQGVTGSRATKDDEKFTKIDRNALNRHSAEQPNVLANRIYGAVGYTFDQECYSLLLGFGSSYEFGSRNLLNQWSVWGKCGLAF